MGSALTRYRVLAYVVGAILVVLFLVAMPLKYLAGREALVEFIGPIHGFLYIVYLLAGAQLALKARWPWQRVLMIALAGIVPFLSFVLERRITAELRVGDPVGGLS